MRGTRPAEAQCFHLEGRRPKSFHPGAGPGISHSPVLNPSKGRPSTNSWSLRSRSAPPAPSSASPLGCLKGTSLERITPESLIPTFPTCSSCQANSSRSVTQTPGSSDSPFSSSPHIWPSERASAPPPESLCAPAAPATALRPLQATLHLSRLRSPAPHPATASPQLRALQSTLHTRTKRLV